VDLLAFVRSRLPPPPARVLEVGCGNGKLATALAAAGYDVTAIDPEAPPGPIFLRATLEELDDPGPFSAVVASRSLHHVSDLRSGVRKIASLGQVVIVEEFAWDRLDEQTADWWLAQRRVAADPKGPGSAAEWEEEHRGLHGYAALREELDRCFEEVFFEWQPYLYRYLGGPASEELERALIAADAIRAVGFRYVGARRLVPPNG
jgi:SAM-dependent methyltransferase